MSKSKPRSLFWIKFQDNLRDITSYIVGLALLFCAAFGVVYALVGLVSLFEYSFPFGAVVVVAIVLVVTILKTWIEEG